MVSRLLLAVVAGLSNLIGLLVARSTLLGELSGCDKLPGGCEGQAVLAPLLQASAVAVGVGVLSAFILTLAVGLLVGRDLPRSLGLRLAWGLLVYVQVIALTALGVAFIPFGLYLLLLLFIVGPPIAVFVVTRPTC